MTGNLKLTKTVKYSKNQLLLFSMMPKDGTRITSTELVRKMMMRRKRDARRELEHPRNLVITTMKYGLIKKVNAHENFRICLTQQSGPYPIEYWIERKKKSDGRRSQVQIEDNAA
jgi:hypothetical protein